MKKLKWNKGGKKRAGKKTEQEKKLGELFDLAGEQELEKISNVAAAIPMAMPNREKLAWSVIDKADLFDEEERERRETFKKKLRRKKMLRGAVGCVAVAAIIIVLGVWGVFDRIAPKTYESSVISAYAISANEKEYPVVAPDADREYKITRSNRFTGTDSSKWKELARYGNSTKKFPQMSKEKIKNSIYSVAEKYCKKNDFSYAQYKIDSTERYQDKDGNPYLVLNVRVMCTSNKQKDDGKKWKDVKYAPGILSDFGSVGEWADNFSTSMYVLNYKIVMKC